MIKVYIAAPFPEIRQIAALASDLVHVSRLTDDPYEPRREPTIKVTSRWHSKEHPVNYLEPKYQEEQAILDLIDIQTSDLLLFVQSEKWTDRGTGGRHFEMGYAAAIGKKILIYGVPSTAFHYTFPIVHLHQSLLDLVKEIEKLCSLESPNSELSQNG